MFANGLIPVFGAFQRIAHFFPQNDDLFYLSSNCVNISRNQMCKLKDDLKDKINELKDEIIKIVSDKMHYKTVKQQNNDINEYFKNNLTALYSEYERAVKKDVYSPFVDCDYIRKHQEKHNKKLLQKFNDFLESAENDLLYSSYRIFDKLEQEQMIREHKVEKLNSIHDVISSILNAMFNNNISVKAMEMLVSEFVRKINKSDIFKSYFFDEFITIKSNELKLTKKVVVDQVKKMAGKYKKIMKLRKQNFSVNKYWDLVQLMKQNDNEIRGLIKDYDNMVDSLEKDILKYRTGYEDGFNKYKLRPFYGKQHFRELNKIKQLFYNDDYLLFGDLEEEKRNVKYYEVPSFDYLREDNDYYYLEDKYFDSLMLIRLLEKEKEQVDKLSEDADPDSVSFIDYDEEVIEIKENEEEEYDENETGVTEDTEHHLKNLIIGHIDKYFEDNLTEDNQFENKTVKIEKFSPSPDRIFLIIYFDGVNNGIVPKMEYEDQYYLKEMENADYLDKFIEFIENIYNN